GGGGALCAAGRGLESLPGPPALAPSTASPTSIGQTRRGAGPAGGTVTAWERTGWEAEAPPLPANGTVGPLLERSVLSEKRAPESRLTGCPDLKLDRGRPVRSRVKAPMSCGRAAGSFGGSPPTARRQW